MRKSITLMETIVGAIILAAAFGVLLSSFMSLRSYVERANRRLIAVNLGRSVYNRLYRDVVREGWDCPNLSVAGSPHNLPFSGGNVIIDGVTYDGNYSVACVTQGSSAFQQISVNITHPSIALEPLGP